MTSRRDFLQLGFACAALMGAGSGSVARAAARQALSERDLLDFEPLGNITIAHITDIHGQLKPVYFREPSINLGLGDVTGLPPHITGAAYLKEFGIEPGSAQAYALTSEDYVSMARGYGRMGGLDRVATVLKSIRAGREDNTLFLDGGDTWQGSYTSLMTKGRDMVEVMNLLKPDAMTGHWEFTYGTEQMGALVDSLDYPFLGGNVRDVEWDEPAYPAISYLDRGGIKVAVIGQAFPYTPIANPRYMMENLSFGIREEDIQAHVEEARGQGAELIVLLSHNGFDVDRKLAGRVSGIDVILTGHTHDAMPRPIQVGSTLLIATGSNGKFLSRLDLDVVDGKVREYRYRLIPIFSDVITPDPEVAAAIERVRAPYMAELTKIVGRTESLLYRRGNFNGTVDDLICDAMIEQRDVEISLSPGFRWGTTILPDSEITAEDMYNALAITYPESYRTTMTGAFLREILEDVADNLFNVDPYYQQGGDMVRVGGMAYTIAPAKKIGSRISNMVSLRTGKPIDADREYSVSGWASVNEDTQGPPIWDVVTGYLGARDSVTVAPTSNVKVLGV
ncbi:MAG: thiosulfohydrolase SoxB [Alphaproteobacteria bacterium]